MNAVTWSTSRLYPSPLLGELRARHALWTYAALAALVLMTICASAPLIDDRLFNGVSVWSKPFKFSLSIAVYFATLAWYAPLLSAGYFETRRGRTITTAAVVCAFFELAYITYQAALGEASHFNNSTLFHAAMFALMGVGALTLVAVCLWLGLAVLRRHRWSEPYAMAVGVGLILTFVLGGGLGGYLSAQGSHWVSAPPTDAGGLPLLHWTRDGGDLRVAHFFGIHAMQALPLFAAALLRSRLALPLTVLFGCAYVAFTLATFFQAVAGQPFL